MSAKLPLSEIEQVRLRDIWPNEANDFTTWLAVPENLSKLGNACGIELEPYETESAVGTFSVDIFARELDTERPVVIENQLEDTNHDHLGKLITYAAGKDAGIIIWVVKRARGPHRKAIEWLNNHTDGGCAFFLVEVEAWRIDQSNPAVVFNVVESPNDWARDEKGKTGLTQTERAAFEYWQTYYELASSDADGDSDELLPDASKKLWIKLNVGSAKYFLAVQIYSQYKRVSVEVRMTDDAFSSFINAHTDELMLALGQDYDEYETRKENKGIVFHKTGCDVVNGPREKWPEYIGWQRDKLGKLYAVVGKLEAEFEQGSTS